MYIYVCMSDKIRLTAMDSYDNDQVKYHFGLLLLELALCIPKPSHVTNPLTARPHSQAAMRYKFAVQPDNTK